MKALLGRALHDIQGCAINSFAGFRNRGTELKNTGKYLLDRNAGPDKIQLEDSLLACQEIPFDRFAVPRDFQRSGFDGLSKYESTEFIAANDRGR